MKKTPFIIIMHFCFFLHDAISELSLLKMSSMNDLKAISDLTAAELEELRQRCFKDCVDSNGHLLYKGQDGPRYPQITFKLRAKEYKLRKAQLALFLKMKEGPDSSDMASWTEDMSTSHLCHKKACLKPEHITLESYEKNRERDGCWQNRRCFGHNDSPPCLL